MTPLQLYMASPTTVDLMLPEPDAYGVEEKGPIPDVESPDTCVIVDPPVYALFHRRYKQHYRIHCHRTITME